jgi:hypothetical protein
VWEKPAGFVSADEAPLPAGWSEFETDEGKKYYVNDDTGDTVRAHLCVLCVCACACVCVLFICVLCVLRQVWEKPAGLVSADETPLPAGWSEFETDEGKKYYVNDDTGNTVSHERVCVCVCG